jgi:hypothetical protein
MTRFLKPFAIITSLLCCFFYCRGQNKDTIIKHSRKLFQKINNDHTLKKLELDNEDFLPGGQPDGGTSLTGYYKKDTIYKLSVWIGLSYCVRQYDYYLKNGKPFFIYETEKDFPETKDGGLDNSKLNLAFEGRYYLDDGKAIDIKITGKKRMDEKTTTASIMALVADAKSYAKLMSVRVKKLGK